MSLQDAYEENLASLLECAAENAELRKALKQITGLALAPMMDMADPVEHQARDWAHVAELAWTIARKALGESE